MTESEIDEQIRNCVSIKPRDLIISDLKWKYLIRSVLKGKNIMIVGPSGCAKTMSAKKVSEALFEQKEEILTEEQLTILKNSSNIKIQKIEEI